VEGVDICLRDVWKDGGGRGDHPDKVTQRRHGGLSFWVGIKGLRFQQQLVRAFRPP